MIEEFKYFKDIDNVVYAYYADGSQDDYIKDGLTPITYEEAMDIVNPPPTHEQLIATADKNKASLRSQADSEIAWLQDAVDIGIATDEEIATLAEWKKYRILLMRVDTSTAPDSTWPEQPQ